MLSMAAYSAMTVDIMSDAELTRIVRKSDYTPALGLSKHMASIFEEKKVDRKNKLSPTDIPNMSILACMVLEKSLTKNFILRSMEGKKSGQMQRRISWRRLVLNPTIQQAVINLHIKYKHSSLHGCGEIVGENLHYTKYGRKENWTNAVKKKENAGSQSHNTTGCHQPVYQI